MMKWFPGKVVGNVWFPGDVVGSEPTMYLSLGRAIPLLPPPGLCRLGGRWGVWVGGWRGMAWGGGWGGFGIQH